MKFKRVIDAAEGELKQQAEEARFRAFQRENDRKANEKAFKEYYEAHTNAIYVFAYNLLQNKSDAEDVTAKTFFALWEKRLDLENPRHVIGYLYMVARNAATDILRSRARSMAAFKQMTSMQKQVSHESDLDMVEAEVLSRLFAEVQKMPDRMRDIFILTYLKKLPAAKVSELMGVQSVTVYTVCQRAMQRLKLAMLDHRPEAIAISIILSFSAACL